MKLATWQPSEALIKHIESLNKKGEFGAKDTYIDDNEYKIWCVKAESLEELIANSLLTCVKFPEELWVFETEDYKLVDKSKWYKAIHNHKKDEELINPYNYTANNGLQEPVEFLVKEIPKDCVRYTMAPPNITLTHPILNKVAEKCQTDYRVEYQLPTYSSYVKTFNNLKENQIIFITYLLPLLWLNEYVFTEQDMDNLPSISWRQAELIDRMFIGYNINDKDATNDILKEFQNWDSPVNNWELSGHRLLEKSCYNMLKVKVLDIYIQMTGKKIGRNDLCPCGSKKKLKRCHST